MCVCIYILYIYRYTHILYIISLRYDGDVIRVFPQFMIWMNWSPQNVSRSHKGG